MLRAAGIPARLAVGYSQGEQTDFGFQVRLNNGHAWPEVYFPNVGWVPLNLLPFNLTCLIPPLRRRSVKQDN